MAGKLLVVQTFTVIVEQFNYTELYKPTGVVQNKQHHRVYVYVPHQNDIKVIGNSHEEKVDEAGCATTRSDERHVSACVIEMPEENVNVRYIFFIILYAEKGIEFRGNFISQF